MEKTPADHLAGALAARRCGRSLNAGSLACLPRKLRDQFLSDLRPEDLQLLLDDWTFWARDDQLPPAAGQGGAPWAQWVLLGGRGAGKTRAGAEWLRAQMEGPSPDQPGLCRRAALVAETYHDARSVMVEGPSGLLAIADPHQRPVFYPSRRLLVWPNGAQAELYSSEDPEALRGPQFDVGWADELGKWTNDQATWDMLQFALRLGADPRAVITTTPRPTALLKSILGDPHTAVSRARTEANRANLAPGFLKRNLSRYLGTALGRQELDGELVEDLPGALWTRQVLERCRRPAPKDLVRIVVGVDPPASAGPRADACGIIVAGRGADGHGYVLSDRTVKGLSPAGWAAAIARAYHGYVADRVVVEVNQGGDMVRSVLAQADAAVPVQSVRATRGKQVRAEPIQALYERGRVHHVRPFPDLEDEMCAFGTEDGPRCSPDRVDALVWSLTALLLTGEAGEPRIRSL